MTLDEAALLELGGRREAISMYRDEQAGRIRWCSTLADGHLGLVEPEA
ncbi:MAG: hypothetical protein U0599_03995 [Vicinamibacteria bacterium]